MRYLTISLLLSATLATAPALADWALDNERSHLTFVSIKAKDVAEIHTFKEMSGTVDTDGKIAVNLMLDSVETLIPIRNERMRELLFETAKYKEAGVEAELVSIEEAPHAFWNMEQWFGDTMQRSLEFFKKHLVDAQK